MVWKNVIRFPLAVLAVVFLFLFAAVIALGAWDVDAGVYVFNAAINSMDTYSESCFWLTRVSAVNQKGEKQ